MLLPLKERIVTLISLNPVPSSTFANEELGTSLGAIEYNFDARPLAKRKWYTPGLARNWK